MYADKLQEIYLDYCNNFITIEGFASYYGLSKNNAEALINLCKDIHENLILSLGK